MFTPKYMEFVIQGILTQYLDSVIKDISTQTFGCLIHIIRKNSICKANLTKFNLQNKSHSFCSMYKTCLWILSMVWLVTSIAPQCPLCRVKCSNLFVASFCFCYQHVTPSLSPNQRLAWGHCQDQVICIMLDFVKRCWKCPSLFSSVLCD